MHDVQHNLIQIFLTEYNAFLFPQNDYDFNIHILNDKMTLNLTKIGYTNGIPEKIDCTISIKNDNLIIEINGEVFEHSENILETYIKNYIKNQIMIKNKNNELYIAADLLGLSLDDINNKKLINERYRVAVNELHPDRWENENNPILTKNAASAVIKFTEARDLLLNNITRSTL